MLMFMTKQQGYIFLYIVLGATPKGVPVPEKRLHGAQQ